MNPTESHSAPIIGREKWTVYTSTPSLRHPIAFLSRNACEIWNIRDLVWLLFIRDLKAQYRQSIMGYFWLFVSPVTTALVWFFLNNQRIIQVETDIPYPLFVLIGTTVWSSFVSLVQQPLAGFNAGKPVFIKLNVPPEAFMFSAALKAIFELFIRALLIVPLFLLFKFTPPATAWFFPLATIFVIVPALAIGVWLVPLGSLFGDISNAVTAFIGLFMYTVPVVFPIPAGDGMLALIMKWNPLTPGVAFCRDLLVNGSLEWCFLSFLYLGASLIVLVVGLIFVRVAKPHLVERMGM